MMDTINDFLDDTALIRAASRGDADIVTALITAGADVNAAREDNGDTALMRAALSANVETVTALLSAPSILVNQTNQLGMTALLMAARDNKIGTVTALLAAPGILINKAKPNGTTALIMAASNGHIATVTALLAAPEIDVHLENEGAIIRAFARNRPDIVRLLQDHGAVLPASFSPLMIAAFFGDAAAVTTLLTAPNIDVNLSNPLGKTALMIAAINGHTATVTALLAAPGILVNQIDQGGETPLMMAIMFGHAETVTALLAAPGINVHLADQNGDTAITLAFEQGHHNMVALLQRHGAVLPAHLLEEQRAENNINGNQSVHAVSVHISVSESAKNLRAYYKYTQKELDEQTAELFTWLSADFSETAKLPEEYKPEWLAPARKCMVRLNMLEFTDQRSGVSMREALALVWAGINNILARGEDKAELSREEITSRRINFLKNLYEIQRGYNLTDGATPQDNGESDQTTCVSGSFNKLIAALSEVGHVGVQIVFVTPTLINLQVPFLTKQAFSALSEEDRKRFAQSWGNENSEEFQAECFGLLKNLVSARLHETYDEFHAEVPNLDQVITDAAANVQHTDMDAVMNLECASIQKKEQAVQAELERQAAEIALSAALPTRPQRAAVIFSCKTRSALKRERDSQGFFSSQQRLL
jgi:ankyrin repeat protein